MDPRMRYIGVTGFMHEGETAACLAALPPDIRGKFMVGVLASQKTLLGQPNNWKNRYPQKAAIPSLFTDDPRAFNLIHFNTKNNDQTLARQLADAYAAGGPHCHGLQLNIAWPDPAALEEFARVHPQASLVLQIGMRAFDAIESHPARLVGKVFSYRHHISHILLDPSGGLGHRLDCDWIRPFIDELLHGPEFDIGIGIAGGFSATTMGSVGHLMREYPFLSLDAEGRLRSEEDDTMDIGKATAYVRTAYELYG